MTWINTKVEFAWDSKEKKYKEVDVQGYEYSGPIAQCGECFVAGTTILMSDGTYKNIEDIELGDYVKSWNESTNSLIESVEVVEIHQPIHPDMINVEFEDGTVNKNTYDHPYYVKDKGWSSHKPNLTKDRYEVFKDTEINHLESDDVCYQIEDGKLKELKVLSVVEDDWEDVQTYNFGLKEYNTYFANNVLVHNKFSIGVGESVMISGSNAIAHASMSVGDEVLSATIVGVPDTDVASEFLLWEYTGSHGSCSISSQVTLATSSIAAIAESEYTKYLIISCSNGVDGDLKISDNHPILVYSGSNTTSSDGYAPGVWYFEYAGDVTTDMKFLSSSLEEIDISGIQRYTGSVSESFLRFDIEPLDVYFVDGVLVHN
tara:strand:- start:93 stop:1214 length:1122 start_codon:yes stop_codon:yes gene_type:complete